MTDGNRKKKVLVLNRDYMPLHVISWKKAFVKLYSPQKPVSVVKLYEDFVVNSAFREHKVPAVLVVRNTFVKYKRKVLKNGNYRKYIYVRDKNKCQYCGKIFDDRDLTVDHVHPKSKGGSNNWTNLVTCCQPCNTKKADRFCEDAKMHPINPPRELKDIDLMRYYFMSHNIEPEWEEFVNHIL